MYREPGGLARPDGPAHRRARRLRRARRSARARRSIQVFDTWAGIARAAPTTRVRRAARRGAILAATCAACRAIHFADGTRGPPGALAEAGRRRHRRRLRGSRSRGAWRPHRAGPRRPGQPRSGARSWPAGRPTEAGARARARGGRRRARATSSTSGMACSRGTDPAILRGLVDFVHDRDRRRRGRRPSTGVRVHARPASC